MKTKIEIIITILAIILGIVLLNQHQDKVRADYAQSHQCEWSAQAGHDVCR